MCFAATKMKFVFEYNILEKYYCDFQLKNVNFLMQS